MTGEQVELAIQDFRDWIAEWDGLPETDFPAATTDYAAIISGFTALRHDVTLQTKATRQLLDQHAELIKQLQQLVPAPPAVVETPPPDPSKQLIKVLIELYDQLSLALQGIEKRQQQTPAITQTPPAVPVGFWGRLFGKPSPTPAVITPPDDQIASTITALISGYKMSMARIDRQLTQLDVQTIPALGLLFDAELMEAIEVEQNSDQPKSHVVSEIRRGYRRDGKIIRFAQVKVAG